MKKCIIIGGAEIACYENIKEQLPADSFNIFCDSGLKHLDKLSVTPHLIVGDFDSHENPHLDAETIVLPCEKDDTDTMYAVKESVRRGFDEFLIIGAIGARLDHTLGNVSILLYLDSIGKKARLIDDYSEMEIVSDNPIFINDSFSYFSLLAICGNVNGVTIENAKYPLVNAEITCEYQYGISNEVIKGKTAVVTVGDGRLLLVKVY